VRRGIEGENQEKNYWNYAWCLIAGYAFRKDAEVTAKVFCKRVVATELYSQGTKRGTGGWSRDKLVQKSGGKIFGEKTTSRLPRKKKNGKCGGLKAIWVQNRVKRFYRSKAMRSIQKYLPRGNNRRTEMADQSLATVRKTSCNR